MHCQPMVYCFEHVYLKLDGIQNFMFFQEMYFLHSDQISKMKIIEFLIMLESISNVHVD